MWGWSSDALSFFVLKSANNWSESYRFVQLLPLFGAMNGSACEDQTNMTTEYLYTIIHFLMWVWSWDALSFFVSKRVNNCRELRGSVQLLAVCDTNIESAAEDQTHMTSE
jgi:hypothetical protein